MIRTNLRHCEEEPHKSHETPGRQTKQSNQLSLLHKMTAKPEWTQSNTQQNIEQPKHPTMGVTINNDSNVLSNATQRLIG